jgi:hypothetical protein
MISLDPWLTERTICPAFAAKSGNSAYFVFTQANFAVRAQPNFFCHFNLICPVQPSREKYSA